MKSLYCNTIFIWILLYKEHKTIHLTVNPFAWYGAAPVLLKVHWLEHNNVSAFNEYAGFKVIYVYARFMGVPLQFVNKHVFTVILLKVHWADCDLFTRTKHIVFFCMNACRRFVCVPLQCLNKTLLYCTIYPLITLVLYFPILFLWSFIFRSCIFMPWHLVPHFQVLHFQSTRC